MRRIQIKLQLHKVVGTLFLGGLVWGVQAIANGEAIAQSLASSKPALAQNRLPPSAPVNREDFYVTSEQNVQLFVREVLPSSTNRTGTPVLFIHGGGAAGLSNFDLNVPGYSIAEEFVAAGHSVYIMDVRGFGRSTRPASFNLPVEEAPPAVPSEEAVRDIGAVVDWIRTRNEGMPIALVGWATGGHWAGMYTSQNNHAVSHLAILNSLYGVDAPWQYRERFEDPDNPGEYDRSAGDRTVTAEQLTANWDSTIPVEDLSQWRDPAVKEAYQRMTFAAAPTSSTRTPPSIRIPGAFRLEAYYLSRGRQYWDAADIRVPILIVRGEQDHWSRPVDVEALAAELVNAPQVETVIIPDGTHFLFLDRPERGRDRFIQAVQTFLEKAY